jgi:glutathione S-transferase
MSMTLYDWNNSYNSRKIAAIAFETDQPITCKAVDMKAGEHKTPAFLKMNPNGKVPVLVDGNFQLWESNAIACYVASKDPSRRLLPAGVEQRANIDKWIFWQTAHLSPAIGKISYERYWKKAMGLGECDESVVTAALPDANKFLGILDAQLATHQWVAGDLSVADFIIAAAVMFVDTIKLDISQWKNVTAWYARIESRPSWSKGASWS